jgi:hypothetical protein
MRGAVFLLSRQVEGDSGETYTQNITVFAATQKEAHDLVLREFDRIRRISGGNERAYRQMPEFAIEKVTLNEAKVITNGITG